MRLIALDTETELIARGRQVPPLVCLSWAELHLAGPQTGTIKASGLLHHTEALPFLLTLLADSAVLITGASIAYDVLVTSCIQPYPTPEGPTYHEHILALWVAAYNAGRVTDVLIRQKLLDLAAGVYRRQQLSDGRWVHHRYNLAAVAQRMAGLKLNKASTKAKKRAGSGLTQAEQSAAAQAASEEETDSDDADSDEKDWQLRYGELRDKPLSEWPAEARDYPVKDAEAPALVWWAQQDPAWRAMQSRRNAEVGHVLGGYPIAPSSQQSAAAVPPAPRTRPGGAPIIVQRSLQPASDGWNIWSGTRDGAIAAALTNPTEISLRKGTINRSYPLDYRGQTWPDLETAWFALSKLPSESERDMLMVDMIHVKLTQYPQLAEAVDRAGAVTWLEKCSHFTNARTEGMQAWEGKGTASRFIRNLIRAYCRLRELTYVAPANQNVATLASNSLTHGPPQQLNITAAPDFLWRRIRENFGTDADPYKDQHRQIRGALWLRAMSSHGMVTDPEAVEKFVQRTIHKHAEVTERLVKEGLVRVEWHLDKEELQKWVADRGGTGTKKAELTSLLQRIPADDRDVLLCALEWLPISRVLRTPNEHDEGTLDWYSVDEAKQYAAKRFALLEANQLANRTFHRDTKAAAQRMVEACQAEGIPVLRTGSYDPGKHGETDCVALDKDACNSVQDEVLKDYSELSHLGKMLSADIPVLRSGAIAPIHTHFEELLETGRTGSSKPNVQNRARGEKCQVCRGKKSQVVCLHCMGTGAELGDRECFVPRPGWVMVDSDYNLGELHTLAQACLWLLGDSELAKVLRKGLDPHTAMACEILGITYEEGLRLKKAKDGAFDNARNAAKAVNFGKPGGLSAATMRAYAVRTYGVDKPLDEWERILKIWERLWTEMPAYFKWVDKLPKRKGQASIARAKHEGKIQQLYSLVQPYSQRLRAGATYCATCNSVYQGLLSDVLKLAGWYIFCCCYLSPATVEKLFNAELAAMGAALYGCRPCNEIHDQFLVEVREEGGAASPAQAAKATGALMNKAGAEVLPDVPVKCEPILARRWSKRADLVRREDGVMVAWEDPRLVRAAASVN